MIRDRFELLMNAIKTGTEIKSPRSRIETLFSAIAAKIGEIAQSAGGATYEETELLENPITTAVGTNNLTASIDDFNYIVFCWHSTSFDQYNKESHVAYAKTITKNSTVRFWTATNNYVQVRFNELNVVSIEGASSGFSLDKIIGVKF